MFLIQHVSSTDIALADQLVWNNLFPLINIFSVTVVKCTLRGGGGGQAFFRVIISFGLGPPEVAPFMTGTFGEVFGPRNQTGSEPRPARK